MALTGKDLDHAAALLKEGKLVAIPTETVYGLAGNALNEDAVLSIFEAKERPQFNPIIVHARDLEQIQGFVADISAAAKRLADTLWPGPLTILLPRITDIIPDIVTAGSPMVAVRIPQHPMTLDLLNKLEFPLAAPSANPFGYISPTTPQHVAQQLGDKISYILDGGPTKIGVESTIVTFEEDQVIVLRLGGVSIETLEMFMGKVKIQASTNDDQPLASGMLRSHYAPVTPFRQGDVKLNLSEVDPEQCGIISYKSFYPEVPESQQRVLSPQGDLHEAARRLFAAMRELDHMRLKLIFAEIFPEVGLGKAINDRLRRASQPHS